MRERVVEQRLVAYVERIGGKAYKFVSPANRGVPDRLCVLPQGRIVFVELKAPGKLSTPLQQKIQRQLVALGAEVRVWDGTGSVEEALA